MIAQLISGKADAADILFLIAAVVFAIAAVLPHTHPRTEGARWDLGVSLLPAGLCLTAIAFWLL